MRVRPSHIVALVWLLATGVFTQSQPAAQERFGQIAGVVRDASGSVLPGVTVEVTSRALVEKFRSTNTDADGRYRIAELPVGTYSITFSLPGFWMQRREQVELVAGFTVPVNATMRVGGEREPIVITTDSANLKGAVVDASDFVLLGVKLTLTGQERRTATSAKDGEFSFANLASGDYDLKLELEGFNTTVRKVSVSRGTKFIRIEMDGGKVPIGPIDGPEVTR